MTTVGTYLNYLRVHRGPRKDPARVNMSRENLMTHLNEAIQDTARLLIDAKEPWMVTKVVATLTKDQETYTLNNGGIMDDSANLENRSSFARPHSLRVLSEDGKTSVGYRIVTLREGSDLWAPAADSTEVPVASLRVASGDGTEAVGAGGAEAEFEIVLWRPPNYTKTGALEFYYYFLPSMLSTTTVDGWEPAIPRYADRCVKLYALRSLYLSEGMPEFVQALEGEIQRAIMNMTSVSASTLSDDPQYVRDEGDWDDSWVWPYY